MVPDTHVEMRSAPKSVPETEEKKKGGFLRFCIRIGCAVCNPLFALVEQRILRIPRTRERRELKKESVTTS